MSAKLLKDVVTVHRPEWTPASTRRSKNLIRHGCEKIGGKTYIRAVRWNPRRRAFVLEALILARSETFKKL